MNQKKSAVGIDIEFSKKRNFSALMAHFAPQAEQDWFAKQPDEEAGFFIVVGVCVKPC